MNKLILVGLLVLVLFSAGCIGGPSHLYREDPFGGNLTYSGEPKVGEEFELVFIMKPIRKFDNVTINFIIKDAPGINESLEIIEGSTTYSASFENPVLVDKEWISDEKRFPLKLRAREEGKYEIIIEVRGYSLVNNTWVPEKFEYNFYYLYIISSSDSGEFSTKPQKEFFQGGLGIRANDTEESK